jgi:hypothetical protein
MTEPEPRFIFMMGDVHGNLRWVLHALDEASSLFTRACETHRIIIQLGDFGFKPVASNRDLQVVNAKLAERDMELWFIDGNHDFHPDLQALQDFSSQFDDLRTREVTGIHLPGLLRIRYLPRGTRWTWAGKRWLAVGGAVSVDRRLRTTGRDWWLEEEITPEQATAIIKDGPADVLLSHDCPRSWFPWDRLGPPAEAWKPVLADARLHSARLEQIARGTGVTRVFHGHYHIDHDTLFKNGLVNYPDVHVTGLSMDGGSDNYRLIDAERLQ